MTIKFSTALASLSLTVSVGHILYCIIVPRVKKRHAKPPIEIMKEAFCSTMRDIREADRSREQRQS